MRASILVLLLATAGATAAFAQEPPPLLLAPDEGEQTVLPEIIVKGRTSSLSDFERCVDVEIGGSRSFNCLNDRIRRTVEQSKSTATVPPIKAGSADVRVGVVNVPALQQQYGRNFGVSVRPYRPPPAAFSSPLAPR